MGRDFPGGQRAAIEQLEDLAAHRVRQGLVEIVHDSTN